MFPLGGLVATVLSIRNEVVLALPFDACWTVQIVDALPEGPTPSQSPEAIEALTELGFRPVGLVLSGGVQAEAPVRLAGDRQD